MKFNKNYFEEYKDQFNYYNIIQKIHPGYRLYFNKKNKKFAVINIHNNYEICMDFDGFFDNIESILRFSKIENMAKIFNYIEANNHYYETKQTQNKLNILKENINEFNKFSSHSKTISQTDINKIIGVKKC